uniref:HP4 n=1 Tax=Sesame deltaflexivirus 1 TaxID=2794418 RepID=A0A7T5QZD9_9VIRU|nr:HP4 [Sesame deltaflexivirus 1]
MSAHGSLPPLHSTLGEHFLAVSALFQPNLLISEKPKLVTKPPPKQKNRPEAETPLTSVSPLSTLVGWWSQHSNFFEFLLISHHALTPDLSAAPTFPQSSILDPLFVPGNYSLDDVSLMLVDEQEEWVADVHDFTMAEKLAFPYPSPARDDTLFFRVSP